MGMRFAPTWLRQVSPPPLHKTTLTTESNQETEHVQNTNQWNPQNGPSKQQYKNTQKKPRLRDRGQNRAWFSRLLRHPARKRSGSLFLQPRSPTRGN